MQQDWDPIIIKKTAPKPKQNITYAGPKITDDDNLKINYVTREQSNLIIGGRTAKKLTRKQLANLMQIQEVIVAEWETGKAIYSGPMYGRFKRFLGVTEDKKK
jgi:ribosome-binding protein aMBF1 (putative translation factor)